MGDGVSGVGGAAARPVQVFVVVSVCVTEPSRFRPLGTWEMTGW